MTDCVIIFHNWKWMYTCKKQRKEQKIIISLKWTTTEVKHYTLSNDKQNKNRTTLKIKFL